MHELLHLYRERNGNPAFWGEPLNAISNISFILAALLAWYLASRRKVLHESTLFLLVSAFSIGIGSFIFHTHVSLVTKWLDIIPILIFKTSFLWLTSFYLARMNAITATIFILIIVTLSLILMPIHNILNGSLFYIPAWSSILLLSLLTRKHHPSASYYLFLAWLSFTVAITFRSIDWLVPWSMGSHFLWHTFNGLVIFFGLYAWIISQPFVHKSC